MIGLAAGLLIVQVRRRLQDPPVESTISLLTGFVAYLPAAALGASGVLSVVATGLYLERMGPRVVSPQTRIQTTQMWQVVTFLFNGLLFILVGFQLNTILASRALPTPGNLLLDAGFISLTIIIIRILWTFPGAYLPFFLNPRLREREPLPPWKSVIVVAWTGMRGGVSLAAALALNPTFPDRALIVFLAFCVILATLVVQGLTLPPLIRWLNLSDDGTLDHEEEKARLNLFHASLERLDELANEDWVPQEILEELRTHYTAKKRKYKTQVDGSDSIFTERIAIYRRLQREILAAKRKMLIELRDKSIINDDVLRKIQRDLDIEEIRLPV